MNKITRILKKRAKKWVLFIVFIIARGATVRFPPLRWTAKVFLLMLFWLVKNDAYALISYAANAQNNSEPIASSSPNSQRSLRFFVAQVLVGDKATPVDRYCSLLSKTQPTSEIKYELLQRFMNAGRLDLAKAAVVDLMAGKPDEFYLKKRLQIYRTAGVIFFMLGHNKEANDYWRLAGEFRKTLFKPSTPTKYRILGNGWFVAIGHVAMLDYYLKYKRLYGQDDHRIVATPHANFGCTSELMRKFSELGIAILNENELHSDYDQWAKRNGAPLWQQLSELEREALIDDFWEHEFPDGQILSYTHAAARIQKEWEQSGRSPLLAVTMAEKKWLDAYLTRLGLPPNAWFACVHVREAGFHKQWNSKLPAMRDSEIEDYYPAIQEIVNAGGWVLRMGDPSMKKIPSMPHVIDYALSIHKEPFADMLLAASCRFFLGTNSGFATIPAIYGIPCALSNWVPVGWPLWPSQDLMICKLFREKRTQRLLALEEIFKRGLAFLQNRSDLPEDIELVPNTPEEIRLLTLEMLSCFGSNERSLMEAGAPIDVQNYYTRIAERYETFTSSRMAESFVNLHPGVFNSPEEYKRHNSDEKQAQLQETGSLA